MNLYTVVTNDRYEFPVKCDIRAGEAARFLGVSASWMHRIVHDPQKKSRYRVIVSGKVKFDKRAYDKWYGMTHDRSRYFSERGKRVRQERKRIQMENHGQEDRDGKY